MSKIRLDQRGTYWTVGNLHPVSSFFKNKFVGHVLYFPSFNLPLPVLLMLAEDQLASKQIIMKRSLSLVDLSIPKVSYTDK
jgi:hypothetical protein